MPNQVSKSQFKAKALEFFRQVEVSGESLIITDMASPNWKFGVISHNRMTRFPDDAARFCATGIPANRSPKTTGRPRIQTIH